MIEFYCSKCGKRLSVQDSAAGKYGNCPHCNQKLLIPELKSDTLQTAGNAVNSCLSHIPPKVTEEKYQLSDIWFKKILPICKLILGLVIIVAIFAFPAISISLGVGCLILCALVFSPTWRWIPKRIILLTEDDKVYNRIRIAVCGGLGVILICIGCFVAGHKASIAGQIRHIEEANRKVHEYVTQAEVAMNQGDFELANQKLTEATRVSDAKDFEPVNQFRPRLLKAQCQSSLTVAKDAMKTGNIDTAKQYLQSAKQIADTKDSIEIQRLESLIETATNPTLMYNILMQLSSASFEQLTKSNEIPSQLLSGYKGLDELTAKLIQEQLPNAIAARGKIRQEKLERERAIDAEIARSKKEAKEAHEREIAEAAKKAAEERNAKEEQERASTAAARKAIEEKNERLSIVEAKRKLQEASLPLFPCQIISAQPFKNVKLSLDIRLLPINGIHPTNEQLKRLAKHLFEKYKGAQYQRVFMCYYLPNMIVGNGAWATTHYNPNLEVRILGNNWPTLPISKPVWESLQAKCRYRFIGEFPLMPKHPDELKGDTVDESLDELAKIKTITTGVNGVSVYIWKVRLSGKTPWYLVEFNKEKGWVNSIALIQVKINKE